MHAARDSYTRYPRAILWLIRGGSVTIGGGEVQPSFDATVDSFYLSKLPITNVQYEAFDPDFERAVRSAADDDPAVGVDYTQARGYCEWYAEISRKPMRLPTEIEWEYACRGGGAEPAGAHIIHEGNSAGTLPPLSRTRPNPFGLHAMLGGVWEWTGSLHHSCGDGRDDPRAEGPRVLRGGSYRTPLSQIGCGVRRAAEPGLRADDIGFRVARALVDHG